MYGGICSGISGSHDSRSHDIQSNNAIRRANAAASVDAGFDRDWTQYRPGRLGAAEDVGGNGHFTVVSLLPTSSARVDWDACYCEPLEALRTQQRNVCDATFEGLLEPAVLER